ncbi:hypothetical protein LX32DRAFT_630495 [Colletotrichum zoysiae]|uniref:NACHT domain-containing protein n=1 Tax=Colletotrichum zoysiae TaxID=1216348 RepID=A0AAD9LXV2_9PEZI|nr:hypothetical protein LX32DRAFT_630495 [Colletotrichum zoysiae]
MDPVSAFGLAVNVLAVVDFSKTFIEILGQVKDAGSSTATRNIVDINRRLKASTAKLTPELLAEGENETVLKNLVKECQNLSDELIHLAEDLSVASSSKLASKIKVTTRTMWNHGKIQEKKAQLEAIREQLLFDIVVPMAMRVSTIPDMAAMDTQTQTLLKEIKAGEDAKSAMEKRLQAFHEEYAAVEAERHVEIVSMLNDMRDSKPQAATPATRESTLESKKQHLKDLLDWLYFRQETDRFHDIKPAHKGTFEWIYSKPRLGASGATWTNFHNWLRNDSGIYWISGKAGSGKSTLMKFISTDERTRQPLLDWGVGCRLLILSFYFWDVGTRLQKSLEGLFRSIISQALKECPELADKLFPDRFERRVDNTHPPTIQELERAFACLTAPGLVDASLTPVKVVLLVDGLDEFDTGFMSLTELSTLFTAADQSTSFKAVLSSRPENAFEEAFINFPRLRLHFLTHDDVVKYVNEKLNHYPRMVQLALQAPDETRGLTEEIVEAAQGVFLWVRLVVSSLSEGLQNHDEIGALTERLRELPTDLEDLFRVMLQKVPPRYKGSTSKIFQLLRSYSETLSEVEMHPKPEALTALGLKFALLPSKEVLQANIRQFSDKTALEEIRSIEAQVKISCSGLIELSAHNGDSQSHPLPESGDGTKARKAALSPIADESNKWRDPKIDFIHRSVKEYLWKDDVWSGILAQAGHEAFHAGIALLQSLVMQTKKCPLTENGENPYNSLSWAWVSLALEISRKLEIELGTNQIEMLTAFEAALTTRCGPDWWDTYEEDYNRPVKWHDDFFAFAVRYGLCYYVRARLQMPGLKSIDKPGRPLLDYACRPEPLYPHWRRGTDPRVVKALLQHGADPNKKFNGFSPWQNAWYTFWRKRQDAELLQVLELLLAYGADPNAWIEVSKRWSKRWGTTHRLSVLLVALELHERWKVLDDNTLYITTLDPILSRIIKDLKKRGGKVRDWKEVDGVFIRQRSSSQSHWQSLKKKTYCILF